MAGSSTDVDQRGNKCRQMLIIILATLANFSIGTNLAWTSPILFVYSYENSLNLDEQDTSWLCSLVPLGAVMGSLLAEVFANRFGRKRSIQVFGCILIPCWLLTAFVTNVIWLLFVRFVAGIVCGVFSIIIPIYLDEVVDNRYKKWLDVILAFQEKLGIFCTYLTGFTNYPRTITLLCFAPSAILFLASFILPESPVWLTIRNRQQETEEAMIYLRRNGNTTEEDTGRDGNDAEQRGCVSVFKAHMKATFIAFGLIFLQNMSGAIILVSYSSTLIERLKFSLTPIISSVIAGLALLIATCCTKVLLYFLNTKLLLYLGLSVMSVCLFILSAYFRLQNTYYEATEYSWLPFLSIVLFLAAYTAGSDPMSWIVIERIFPRDVRHLAVTGSKSCNWMSSFVAAKAYQDMMSLMGISAVFAVYGMFTLAGIAFVACMVPEIEGKTEEQLQTELRRRHRKGNVVASCFCAEAKGRNENDEIR